MHKHKRSLQLNITVGLGIGAGVGIVTTILVLGMAIIFIKCSLKYKKKKGIYIYPVNTLLNFSLMIKYNYLHFKVISVEQKNRILMDRNMAYELHNPLSQRAVKEPKNKTLPPIYEEV